MLFRRRAIVETFMWSFMVVEVEVGGQAGVQLTERVILVEIEAFT